MVYWLLILFALAGVLLAWKKSTLYKMSALFFNITIAIYVSVLLSRSVSGMIPEDIGGVGYQKAACIFGVAVIVFGILQSISVNFITADHEITFPDIFSSIGTLVLGFLSGWFIMAFLLFIICIMPFSSKASFMHDISGTNEKTKSSVGHVIAVCNLVSNVSIQRYRDQARRAIYELTIIKPQIQDEKKMTGANKEISPLDYLNSDME